MKKALTRGIKNYWYIQDGVKVFGKPEGVSGDLSSIRGNLTGISGDLTDISGDIDDCEITDEERRNGVDIDCLIVD